MCRHGCQPVEMYGCGKLTLFQVGYCPGPPLMVPAMVRLSSNLVIMGYVLCSVGSSLNEIVTLRYEPLWSAGKCAGWVADVCRLSDRLSFFCALPHDESAESRRVHVGVLDLVNASRGRDNRCTMKLILFYSKSWQYGSVWCYGS